MWDAEGGGADERRAARRCQSSPQSSSPSSPLHHTHTHTHTIITRTNASPPLSRTHQLAQQLEAALREAEELRPLAERVALRDHAAAARQLLPCERRVQVEDAAGADDILLVVAQVGRVRDLIVWFLVLVVCF